MAAAMGVMRSSIAAVSGPAVGSWARSTDVEALRGGIVKLPVRASRGLSFRAQAGENPSAVQDKGMKKGNTNGSGIDLAPGGAPQNDEEIAFATTAKGAPVTFERPEPKDLTFDRAWQPRAIKAVDNEHPYGTENFPDGVKVRKDLTVLQQHVDFFDSNKDGWIYPWETFSGFRRIGFNPIISLTAAFVINGAFSYPSQPSWVPSPFFGIYTKNIHKTKHGSDTEVYDTEGRFVPAKFEEIFSKHAKTYPDRMNWDELNAMTAANSNVLDFFGITAAKLEWGITFQLCKDDSGFASKDAIRGVYDGSFFVFMENKLNAEKGEGKRDIGVTRMKSD